MTGGLTRMAPISRRNFKAAAAGGGAKYWGDRSSPMQRRQQQFGNAAIDKNVGDLPVTSWPDPTDHRELGRRLRPPWARSRPARARIPWRMDALRRR